ncbi:Crp/Fnr family transcriptional regulator [Flavobacterium sp. HBTb2-11-1]|uniref:Crp/Fnr family transcriptional regulator n=1 Tax=Flavobacterium sp. HBTb2-11-1 TaxID=2692212 RepID=UPI00136E504D|nr:Crp/Fnr family transcriptional regulator [Flavobacterium sp. HBTb2-11-1]MXO06776.1 cyclic nucleotide-binding domain-containing protein [Flavobacterium sp. HBTb2-11-1]
MNNPEQFLKTHIDKTVPLTDEEAGFIISHFDLKSFRKGEFIIEEGNEVNEVYFVLSGLVKLVYEDQDAKKHIVSFAMEDWWETDFQAFYTQSKAQLTLECIEDTLLYSLSLENFEKLCSDSRKMERFFLRKSIAGHIGSQTRILSFLTSNARERYEQLILKNSSLLQRVPKSSLASYLGVSRETLSRLF